MKIGQANCLVNIGISYSAENKYEEAIEFFFKSLKIREELGDINGMSMCYNNIGVVYKNQKQYDKSIDFYLKSMEIYKNFDNKNNLHKIITIDSDISEIKKSEAVILKEQQKSEALLLNILPQKTAEELKEKGKATPRYYKMASVLFTDFKGFTMSCENLSPEELVEKLHGYFEKFDEITTKYKLEKIKTIGDAYMCAGGIPAEDELHPIKIVLAALEIQEFMKLRNSENESQGKDTWKLRLGIHTGELVAGVVGKKKFAYDVWGDTVNVALRMESSGEVGKVNISESTFELVKEYFECSSRGMIEAKNKGKITMYFVDNIKPEYVNYCKGLIS